jgi:hypothetical protein
MNAQLPLRQRSVAGDTLDDDGSGFGSSGAGQLSDEFVTGHKRARAEESGGKSPMTS